MILQARVAKFVAILAPRDWLSDIVKGSAICPERCHIAQQTGGLREHFRKFGCHGRRPCYSHKKGDSLLLENIATGETSQAITPFHFFNNFNFHH